MAVHLQVQDRALPKFIISHVIRVYVALELVAVFIMVGADQPLPILCIPFLIDLRKRTKDRLLIIQDPLMLVYLLKFVLHAVESVEDVELGLLGLQRAAAVGKAVGLLVQCAEVVQVLLDLFAVPGVFDRFVGGELAAVDEVFV